MNPYARNFGRLLCVAALIAAIGLILHERTALGLMRTEHEELLSQQQEIEQLTRENAELEQLRAANVPVKQLEHDNRDLPKLRNDVRQLRKQATEAAALTAENERLASALDRKTTPAASATQPAGFIPRAAFHDVGMSTPEAAVQTFFYALSHGDIRRLMQCQSGTMEGANDFSGLSAEQQAQQSQSMLEQTASLTGYRIANKKEISPGEVVMGVQGGTDGIVISLHCEFKNNEWTVQSSF